MKSFHIDKVVDFFIQVLPHLSVTFEYVILSLLFGLLLGLLILKLKLGKNRIGKAIANGYITIMRCVPSIVLLFLIYFGMPTVVNACFKISMQNIPPIVYVVITFTLFLGGSTAELMRSAYESVDRGQFEAGVSIGLTGFQTLIRIVIPQAFYAAIPNLGNTVIFLFKEGALGYTIGLQDVLGWGYSLSGLSGNAYALELYVALTFVYWPITIILEKLFRLLERNFSIEHRVLKGAKV